MTARHVRPSPGSTPAAVRSVQRRESCGEVPQLPGLGGDAHAGQLGGPAGGFDDVVEVALGVGAAGDGQADQVHRGRGLGAVWPQAEHDGADLAGPHSAFGVQRAGQRLARVVQRAQVRQQGARVEEDRVA